MNKKILLSRMKRSYFFIIGIIGITIMISCCFIGPLFIDWDPVETNIATRFLPPEGFSNGLTGHILGTDQVGRDVLSRLLIGGQFSIRLAFICVFLTIGVGVLLGLLSGYMGGWVDVLIMRACDAMMAMPGMILAIAIMAILGPSFRNLILTMTIGGWVRICKVTRNDVRVLKQQEFVLASTALGAKLPHILFTQIFPNVTTNIIILGSQSIGITIVMEASLSFLNLGIQPPAPSWGYMISAGRQFLTTQPWLILAPGSVLMLAVLSFNFLGDGIRDILDTKRKI